MRVLIGPEIVAPEVLFATEKLAYSALISTQLVILAARLVVSGPVAPAEADRLRQERDTLLGDVVENFGRYRMLGA